MLILYFVFFKGRYVFSCGGGGGRRAEASEGRVIPLCYLFKGTITHLFLNFLMRIFVMSLYIFLTD